MNKLYIFVTCLGAATMVAAAPPAAAPDIVVSPRSKASFAADVSKDLQHQLDRVHLANGYLAKGAVSIRFEAGTDGKAVNIRTYRSSGNSMLDADSKRVISRLRSLSPLPPGVSQDQVIQANIIVAGNRSQMKRFEQELAMAEARRLASSPAEAHVLALSMASAPAS